MAQTNSVPQKITELWVLVWVHKTLAWVCKPRRFYWFVRGDHSGDTFCLTLEFQQQTWEWKDNGRRWSDNFPPCPTCRTHTRRRQYYVSCVGSTTNAVPVQVMLSFSVFSLDCCRVNRKRNRSGEVRMFYFSSVTICVEGACISWLQEFILLSPLLRRDVYFTGAGGM